MDPDTISKLLSFKVQLVKEKVGPMSATKLAAILDLTINHEGG